MIKQYTFKWMEVWFLKNILLCFISESENKELENYINDFDKNGFEVHLFNDFMNGNFELNNMLSLFDSYFENQYEGNNFYFLSNVKEFFILVYRIYNQVFNAYIYYNDKSDVKYSIQTNSIYEKLIQSDLAKGEVHKNIFTNDLNCEFKGEIKNKLFKLQNLDELLKETKGEKYEKYYYFKEKYYLFEPFRGKRVVVNLEDDDINKLPNYNNTLMVSEKLFSEKLIAVIEKLCSSQEVFLSNCDDFINIDRELTGSITKSPYFLSEFYIKEVELLSEISNDHMFVFLNSILTKTSNKGVYIDEILKRTIESSELSVYEKYFVLYQIIRIGFINTGSSGKNTGMLIRNLYREVLKGYLSMVPQRLEKISADKRNKDFIVVITSQFLTMEHGPTKTALDRCYNFIKNMGKKLVLINTKDLLTTCGMLPFHEICTPNVIKEYEKFERISYKDEKIPFYQCKGIMPNLNEIISIIDFVKREKPYFIFNIGGNNLTTDICSKIVPTIAEATVMGLPMTEGQFSLLGRKKTEGDSRTLKELGFKDEQAIGSNFTFTFKDQVHNYSRKDFKLPEDRFLLLVVGGRLDFEVTHEFIEILKSTIKFGTYIVFAGLFSKYNEIAEKDEVFRENSVFIGFQKDMLAVCEICDLYVNPLRAGGQTSAAEAMYKGIPVVSINYGDVSVCAQEEFCVNDYKEMTKRIKKFIDDKKYYKDMSNKAVKRAKILLDTASELKRNIEIIEKSSLFF